MAPPATASPTDDERLKLVELIWPMPLLIVSRGMAKFVLDWPAAKAAMLLSKQAHPKLRIVGFIITFSAYDFLACDQHRFDGLQLAFEFSDSALLLLKFIQQHRRQMLIHHGLDLSVG